METARSLQDWIQFIDLERLPWAVALVLVGFLAAGWLTRFLDDLGESLPNRRLLLKKSAALSRFAIYVLVAATAAASILVLDRTALLALAGTLGLALGVAFKDVLSSVTGGLLLLIESPFQVGDRIALAGHYGEVVRIGLRSVQLTTLDDNLVTIPNSRLLTEPVASANAGALDCMVVVDFYLRPTENFDRARRLVHEATVTSRYVYLNKPIVTLISDEFLGERLVTVIRVKAYVFDVRFEKSFASDITERTKRAFRLAEIEPPTIGAH